MNQLAVINLGGGALALPAHLQNAPSIVGSVRTSGDTRTRIGLKGREFHIIRNGVEEGVVDTKYLDVIIVGAAPAISRSFYGQAYQEGVAAAPTCYSADGKVPSPDVVVKQSDSCMTCPQNIKGSSLGENQLAKACSFFRRLAVVVPVLEDWSVFQLDVKSQSIWGDDDARANKYAFNEYAKKLESHGIDPGHIVTRLWFDPAVGVPKLHFQAVGYIDAEQLAHVREIVTTGLAAPALEVSMATFDAGSQPQQAAAEASQPAQPITKPTLRPKPAAAPVAAPAQPEEQAEDMPQPAAIRKPLLRAGAAQVPMPAQAPAAAVSKPALRPAVRAATPRTAAPAVASEDLDALLSELET